MSAKDFKTLKELADQSYDRADFENALESYREIFSTCQAISPEAQVHLIGRIAQCLYRTEQYFKTLGEIDRVERNLRAFPIPYAKLQTLKAEFYLDQAEYGKAQQIGEAAFETLRCADDVEAILDVERVLGISYLSTGSLSRARICFEGVLAACRRKQRVKDLLVPLNGLAQVHFLVGEWARAVECLNEGIQTAQALDNKKWIASFSLNLGMIHRKRGEWALAQQYITDGVEVSEDLGHTLGVIRGRISLAALARLERRWKTAVQLLEQCRRLCEKEGYKRETYLCLEGLGEIAFERQDYVKASKYYRRALKIADATAPHGDMTLEIRRRLADLSAAMNKPAEALTETQLALGMAKRLGDRFEEACTHRVLARISWKMGEVDEAHKSFVEAVDSLGRLGEKYERARTLLEFGRFLGDVAKEDEAINCLLRAKELFGCIPSEYWMGVSDLEAAKVRFNKGGADLAVISLDRAVMLFEEIGDTESLEECHELRHAVEKTMVQTSISAGRYPIPDVDPEALLRFLVQETAASKAFAVVMRDGRLELQAAENVESSSVRKLLAVFEERELNAPIICTNLEFDRRFSVAEKNGIHSFIVIPFGPEGERGILYLDRSSPFTQKDLSMSVRLADSLALKIAQIRHDELKAENVKLREELERRGYPEIVTRDKTMLGILNLVEKVQDYSTPVLIEGETGTGKELIAKTIHYRGSRSAKPFITLDCGALPDTLAENELFGHKKGSFTDAKEDKPGLFELANGGSLFLDEVSNLSPGAQAKLLRVLEEGSVRRIGGTRARKVDVRIIAASNRGLEEEVSKQTFREDLYHRLKVMEINLPPLRRRRCDIPVLTQYFIAKYSSERKKTVKGITTEALNVLCRHQWPGNVRQLRNEIERAILLSESGWITRTLFSDTVRKTRPKRGRQRYDIQEVVRILGENNWVKRKAARILGIPESTLRRMLKIHGVETPTKL